MTRKHEFGYSLKVTRKHEFGYSLKMLNTFRVMVVQVTRKHDFGYSLKNIPIPSKKEYSKELTHSVEKFVRNLRWRAHFFLNPNDRPSKETYGFKYQSPTPN